MGVRGCYGQRETRILSDTEGSSTWAKLTQKEIDVIWSQLTNDMEEEVHKKYRVKKLLGKKEVNRPQWVYKKERQEERGKGREGKECLLAFSTRFDRVCVLLVVEGRDPARAGERSKHFRRIVSQIHTLASCHDEHWKVCHEAMRITMEGGVPEMKQYTIKMTDGAEKRRKEKAKSCPAPLSKSPQQVTKPTPRRRGAQGSEPSSRDGTTVGRWDKRPENQERPWKHVALRQSEEALLRSRSRHFVRKLLREKSRTGVGVDGCHPQVPLELSLSIGRRWQGSGQRTLARLSLRAP